MKCNFQQINGCCNRRNVKKLSGNAAFDNIKIHVGTHVNSNLMEKNPFKRQIKTRKSICQTNTKPKKIEIRI